ncbi:MAG: TIGR02444 family protein [Hyphomicrobiales bacterium]|nr:TIGR02444 family protein [Hyphomicrobiales bacterium]PCJ91562.1 MAG: TIGR02444 family protein [Hyphomicrobiales bacterium]
MDDFPFWSFSLDRYMRPGVSTICLRLQETCKVDVNILLFALWLADRSIAVDRNEFRQLIEKAQLCHEQIVIPLRRVRQYLKTKHFDLSVNQVESFRKTIKKQEIAAEKMEQEILFSAFLSSSEMVLDVAGQTPKPSVTSEYSRQNINIYFEILELSPGNLDRQYVAQLIDLCCQPADVPQSKH